MQQWFFHVSAVFSLFCAGYRFMLVRYTQSQKGEYKMRKPIVDYRQFRLSRINEPRFSHLKLLLAWPVYFVSYYLTERFIAAESCHIIHSRLDDIIPFNEFFVIPYVLWYFLVAGSLLYFALYDIDSFKNLMHYIIITQIVATGIFIAFPSRHELRPEVFPRDNILTDCVALLYTIDTSTNVCPSLHVAYSLGIASTWLKSLVPGKYSKLVVVSFCILVCISTVFIKQHSVLDAVAALPMCLLAEILVLGIYPKRRNAYGRT